jgi:transposase-like protein
VVEVADRYGVSRQSVPAWVNRYRAGGLDGLADRSHRPNRSSTSVWPSPSKHSRPRCGPKRPTLAQQVVRGWPRSDADLWCCGGGAEGI